MSSGRYGVVVKQMSRLLGGGTVAALGEGQLLERYATDGDGAAFEALVARHGPMVLGTCRRMLGDRNPHDVDDAFQATFLVLARKAGSIQDANRLGPWLHGVARKVASRSRALSARRNSVERIGGEDQAIVEPDASAEGRELRAVIDEELARLPEKYRVPLVLCYLDGLTHDEAASQLDWPVGTVRSRLAGGRDRLRNRLTRRGMAPSASVPAIMPGLALPEILRTTTVRMATTAGTVPANVATLAKGALIMMMGTQLKALAALALMATLTVGAAGAIARQGGDGQAVVKVEPQSPPKNQDPVEKLQEERSRLRGELDRSINQVEKFNTRLHQVEQELADLTKTSTPRPPQNEDLHAKLAEANRELNRVVREIGKQRNREIFDDLEERVRKNLQAKATEKPTNPPVENSGQPKVDDGAGTGAVTAPQAKPPTVLTLQGDIPLFMVISGDRGRVTMIDSTSQTRATLRLSGTIEQVNPIISGKQFVSLQLKGKDITQVAVFDRKSHRWSWQDLGGSATEVQPYTMGNASTIIGGAVTIGFSSNAPELSRVVVFDGSDGTWAVQELSQKTPVMTAVTTTTVSYLAGRFVYIYSSIGKKWGALELKREMTRNEFQAIMNVVPFNGSSKIIVPEADLIHIYDAKTGGWTHVDTKVEK